MTKSNSDTQIRAEELIRNKLSEKYKWNLKSETIKLPNGSSVQIDGIDRENKVVVEIVARIGSRSPSRDKKIASDALKMIFITENDSSLKGFKRMIVGCCPTFLGNYQGKSKKWLASALSQSMFQVYFEAVELSLEDQNFIKNGQEEQKWDYQEREDDDQIAIS